MSDCKLFVVALAYYFLVLSVLNSLVSHYLFDSFSSPSWELEPHVVCLKVKDFEKNITLHFLYQLYKFIVLIFPISMQHTEWPPFIHGGFHANGEFDHFNSYFYIETLTC